MKVISYKLVLDGVQIAIKSQKDLKNATKILNQELDRVKDPNRYRQIQKDLGALKAIQGEVRQETNRAGKAFIEANRSAAGSYKQLQLQLTRLKQEYKELGAEARSGSFGKGLKAQITSISGELKKIDRGLGDNFRNVGNYASGIKGIFTTLQGGLIAAGITVGIREVSQEIIKAAKIFADFKDQVALLQAITGADPLKAAKLESEARRLGEVTQFTASQVVQLQTEFARVGFNPDKIIEVTEATLNLAVATGEDLPKSAQVAAQTLGGYQLVAADTQRVTDVMAKSFNSSALDLEKFAESTKLVAPVAAQANVDIENITAVLGTLADAGISGTTAGTALRKTFIELTREGSKLSNELGVVVKDNESFLQAMDELSKRQIGVGEAARLVGVNAATAFTVFANNTDKVKRLSEEFYNAGEGMGAAADAAKIVGDSIQGDVRRFSSALESFRIDLVSRFEEPLRNAIQGVTGSFRIIGDAIAFVIEAIKPLFSSVGQLIGEFYSAGQATSDWKTFVEGLKNTLVVLVSILQATIDRITYFVRVIKQAREESTLIGKVFDRIGYFATIVKTLFTELPKVFNGVIEAFKQFQENIFNLDWSESVTGAFDKGYYAADRMAKGVQHTGDVINDFGGESDDVFNRFQRNAKLSSDEVARLTKQVEDLSKKTGISKEKIKSIQGSFIGEDFNDILANTEEEIYKLLGAGFAGNAGADLSGQGGAGKKSLVEEVIPEGSLKALEKRLQELNEQLSKEITTEGMVATLEAIAAQEEKISAVKSEIELIRQGLEQFDLVKIEPIAEVILPDVEAIGFDEFFKELNDEARAVELNNLELSKLQQLDALNQSNVAYEDYQKQREAIALEYERRRLQTELAFAEQGSAEYLKIKDQLFEAERQLAEKNKSGLGEIELKFLQDFRAQAFSSAKQLLDERFSAEKQAVDARLQLATSELDEELKQRLQGVEEGSLAEERIKAEFEQKKLQITKDAARERQQIDIKQAIATTALAVLNALATVRPFFPAGLLAAALATAEGLTQVAVIRKQKYAKGGKIHGRPHSQGGEEFHVRSTGQKVELEGGEGVVNAKIMSSTRRISAAGTPAEIVSAINSMGGYGVPFGGVKKIGIRYKFQDGGVIPTVNPQVASTSISKMEVVAEIGQDSINRIESAVAVGSEKGSKEGSSQAIETSTRERERQAALEKRTSI